MPLDGIATKCLIKELNEKCTGARIQTISMPEKDEIVLTLHNDKKTFRLVISASPSCARMHITKIKKDNPLTPPNFCMFLRKHISRGRIIAIQFLDYERIISMVIENRNDLGDMQQKRFIVELTGRHCNVIVTNSNNIILDALKHVDEELSRVRQIMPAREYDLPPNQNKIIIDDFTFEDLDKYKDCTVEKALLSTIKGFSPTLCKEICHLSNIEGDITYELLDESKKEILHNTISNIKEKIVNNDFNPCVVFDKDKPSDFYPLEITLLPKIETFKTLNEAMEYYYLTKDKYERLNQKRSNMKRILQTNIDRCLKKVKIHNKNISNTENIEKYRIYGELITANLHSMKSNIINVELLNYYTGETITIPLDISKNPIQNSQKYFKRYKKAKSAAEHSELLLKQASEELEYLESTMSNLLNAQNTKDIEDIKIELQKLSYVKIKTKKKRKEVSIKFKPLHFVSSEGYDIYVGRNNTENDYLTFKFANSRDLWLHTQKIHGSHVIVRRKDKTEEFFPDITITEAAVIAAYYSKARNSGQIAVDYSEVKFIKKPNGTPPGYVNYFKYYSAFATSDEKLVNELIEK